MPYAHIAASKGVQIALHTGLIFPQIHTLRRFIDGFHVVLLKACEPPWVLTGWRQPARRMNGGTDDATDGFVSRCWTHERPARLAAAQGTTIGATIIVQAGLSRSTRRAGQARLLWVRPGRPRRH